MNWNGWTIDRIVLLFVSLAYLLVGIQVWMYHYRQNFHHKIMYVPVVTAPIIFLLGVIVVINRTDAANLLFAIALIAGTASGLVGVYRHYKGVGVRVGGYALRNFLIGPPIVLPLVFSALGAFGLIAMYWS